MPEYRILADYNHDGRVGRSVADQGLRQTPPGAVIFANLDADTRAAPAFGTEAVELDFQRRDKARSDNDVLRFSIQPIGTVPSRELYLRTVGWLGERVRLYDARGRRIRGQGSMPNLYRINVPPAGVTLGLEAPTLAGTPLFMPSQLRLRAPRFRFRRDEGLIRLELFSVSATGQRQLIDWVLFSIAPLIFPDNTQPVTRMFICEIEDRASAGGTGTAQLENHPGIADVERALRGTSVSLVRIPHEICRGDIWAQDQFKIGYLHGPSGVMSVVLHYPRMMSNSLWNSTEPINLAGFVRSFLPSRQMGLFDDFWQRQILFTDANGRAHQLAFRESQDVLMIFVRVYDFQKRLMRHLHMTAPNAADSYVEPADIAHMIIGLPQLLSTVVEALSRSGSDAGEGGEAFRASIRLEIDDLRTRLRRIQSVIGCEGGRFALDASSLNVQLTGDQLADLADRLSQMHDASNYGGNYEVSPPQPDAPFGKIVFGGGRFMGREYVDPDLIRFLRSQQAQPTVEVDVSWLHVGHVDELLTFAPVSVGEGDFAILRASPAVAMALLYEAARRHLAGLLAPEDYPVGGGLGGEGLDSFLEIYAPRGIYRTTHRGSSPVTRMLRGKTWEHHHTAITSTPLEPPLIYRDMAHYFTARGYPLVAPYRPGEGEDRTYPAHLSILEFLYFENQTNAEIDALQTHPLSQDTQPPFLQRLDELLSQEFPGTRMCRLPVLFDAVREWLFEATSAFTPNLVNMQIINGRGLVPRPFGPRMRPEDAANVVGNVLRSFGEDGLAGGLTADWFRTRNMTRPQIWVTGTSLRNLADVYRDGFPECDSTEEIERLILSANRGGRSFDRLGHLRRGWHLITIPEDTVDLFEAYTQVVLEAIGLEVRWIDSWCYHLRHGEIHCGTNVEREVATSTTTPWWEIATPARG